MVRYSEYGRSIEGKLARVLDGGQEPDARHVIRSGWLDADGWQDQPEKAAAGQVLMSVYGQSFADRVAAGATAQDPSLVVRKFGGPAAPLSHSVAALERDLTRHSPDVVVLGVLASSLTAINNMSMLGRTFEAPAPFTFPEHFGNGEEAERPEFTRYEDFATAFRARNARWENFRAQVLSRETGIDAFAFDQTPLDQLLLVRLIRRGWVTHLDSNASRDLTERQRNSALALLEKAAKLTQSQNIPLVVCLFHDLGQNRILDETLGERARALGATVISSTDHFSSSNPANYLPDGHFTPNNDQLLATALVQVLKRIPRADGSVQTGGQVR